MLLDAIVVQKRIVDIKQKDDAVPLGHGWSSLAPPKLSSTHAIKPKRPAGVPSAASSPARRRLAGFRRRHSEDLSKVCGDAHGAVNTTAAPRAALAARRSRVA
jgi:hypothetical protein